jgi:hypothetical protein
MIDDLTGRTRFRTVSVGGFTKQEKLALQVEYRNTDSEFSPSLALWRDARTEDLMTLARMQAQAPWAPERTA